MRKYPGVLAIVFLSLGLLFSLKPRPVLTQFTVAVVHGTPFEEIAWEFPGIAEIRFFDDDGQSFRELAEGRVDAVITDRLAGLYRIKEGGYNRIQQVGGLLCQNHPAVLFNKEDVDLRRAFDQELAKMMKDGTYAKLSAEYFGRNILAGIKLPSGVSENGWSTDYYRRQPGKGKRLRFAVLQGINPLRYYDPKKRARGFDLEIVKTVCQRLGFRFEAVVVEAEEAWVGLRSFQYDGILGKVPLTEEQSNSVEFSRPFYISGAQFFVVKGSPLIDPGMLKRRDGR
ncbi:MAG TPA: transporter substrate-binding domain-containing protein [Bacillota bacterium]|nr:transporter substrate-binding domain-containing protein [Bacillota bacterium]